MLGIQATHRICTPHAPFATKAPLTSHHHQHTRQPGLCEAGIYWCRMLTVGTTPKSAWSLSWMGVASRGSANGAPVLSLRSPCAVRFCVRLKNRLTAAVALLCTCHCDQCVKYMTQGGGICWGEQFGLFQRRAGALLGFLCTVPTTCARLTFEYVMRSHCRPPVNNGKRILVSQREPVDSAQVGTFVGETKWNKQASNLCRPATCRESIAALLGLSQVLF